MDVGYGGAGRGGGSVKWRSSGSDDYGHGSQDTQFGGSPHWRFNPFNSADVRNGHGRFSRRPLTCYEWHADGYALDAPDEGRREQMGRGRNWRR